MSRDPQASWHDHYTGEGDSPDWTVTAGVTTRYTVGLDGNLAAATDPTGTTLQLTNLHGDIVATASTSDTGIAGYTEADEYGNPRTPTGTPAKYGWLGGKQRAQDDLGGLTLMGARQYNPATQGSGKVGWRGCDLRERGGVTGVACVTDVVRGTEMEVAKLPSQARTTPAHATFPDHRGQHCPRHPEPARGVGQGPRSA